MLSLAVLLLLARTGFSQSVRAIGLLRRLLTWCPAFRRTRLAYLNGNGRVWDWVGPGALSTDALSP